MLQARLDEESMLLSQARYKAEMEERERLQKLQRTEMEQARRSVLAKQVKKRSILCSCILLHVLWEQQAPNPAGQGMLLTEWHCPRLKVLTEWHYPRLKVLSEWHCPRLKFCTCEARHCTHKHAYTAIRI